MNADQPTTNIAIIGLGKTGRLLADIVSDCNRYKLMWIVKRTRKNCHYNHKDIEVPVLCAGKAKELGIKGICASHGKPDVVIDFSAPEAIDFAISCVKYKIRLVSAITDYSTSQLRRLGRASCHQAILHSANITLGINFLMLAARILNAATAVNGCDINILEEHFKGKKKISGTALKIAELLDVPQSKIHKIRSGGIVGRHEVVFGLPNQTIRIIHESNSRKAFAQGALCGVDLVMCRRKGMHHMEDTFK